MSPTEILGFLAAVCTTASFVPQVWHILKTRDTRALSLMMYLLFTVAGVRHHDWQYPRDCGQQHHAGLGVGDFNLQGAVGVNP